MFTNFGLWTMIWFLTMKKNVTIIAEIATTFTGKFYLGLGIRPKLLGSYPYDWDASRTNTYCPSRSTDVRFYRNTAKQAASAKIMLSWLPQATHLPIATGAVFSFWTWLCLAALTYPLIGAGALESFTYHIFKNFFDQ